MPYPKVKKETSECDKKVTIQLRDQSFKVQELKFKLKEWEFYSENILYFIPENIFRFRETTT